MATRSDSEPSGVDQDTIYSYPGNKTRSSVWTHFGFRKIKEGPPVKQNLNMNEVICRICHRSYKYNGNTTSMIFHLDHEHKELKVPTTPGVGGSKSTTKQPKITHFSNPASTRPPLTATKKKKVDEALTHLIVDKMLPVSLVEHESFKKFVGELDDRYTPPGRKSLLSNLQQTYSAVKRKLKHELSFASDVALTHDAWTSINTESYDTVTVHYITCDWELKSAVLRTEKFPDSHTAENIAESLRSTVSEWGLPEPVLVTDNAANEQKACRLLNWTRIGCYGHRLNLTVKKGLEKQSISRLIGKGRSAVTYFHHSPLASELLHKKQQLLLPESCHGHKLIQDVSTRWNSTLDMLERLAEQTPAIHAAVYDGALGKKGEDLQSKLYTFEEQKLVNDLVTLLKPFKTATGLLSAETVPTQHLVLPTIQKLNSLLQEYEFDSKVISDIKVEMKKQLDNRMQDKDFCLVACLCCPTTKALHFATEEDRQHAKSLLLELCVQSSPIVVKTESDVESEPVDPRTGGPALSALPAVPPPRVEEVHVLPPPDKLDSPVAGPSAPKKMKVEIETGANWLDDIICTGSTPSLPNDVLAHQEVERYLAEPQSTAKPLEWWSEKGDLYPRVAKIAKTYLSVPASSVPSERIFSLAGSLVSRKRSQLKPENVNMIIFLNRNKMFWKD